MVAGIGDGKKQGTAKVIREPPTAELWEQHLKGGNWFRYYSYS